MRKQYRVIEAYDYLNKTKTYKIYERGNLVSKYPTAIGIPTREEADTLVRELEQQPEEPY